ncbi:MAG TPA: S8 family serine peptidase [Candidatus Dormibacteraeota bacterium]|nr:S8 family serine peptidase [Candidatus Dormibacteraeota bacterium]
MVSVAGLVLGVGPSSALAAPTPAPTVVHSCVTESRAGFASCLALRRADAASVTRLAPGAITPNALPSGFGPADLLSAYNLPAGAGAGQTVAIVDAFSNPNIASDLATYRTTFGLGAANLTIVNQSGQTSPLPSTDVGWGEEESLDVDMVSAIAPAAHIILVEANDNSLANLGAAVNEAVALGAKFVSNSYGGGESPSETTSDTQFYNHPGVAVTASSGDSGFGVEFPAAATNVIAVGGTSLVRNTSARGWGETVWSGAGSGCSADIAKPARQANVATNCARRAVADVAAVADPNTGVAVADTFGTGGTFFVFGGTSVAAPIIASVFAVAGAPAAGSTPANFPYANPSSLNDVTSGTNSRRCRTSQGVLCRAAVGWDGPTGLGTPNGTGAFHA